MNRMIKIGDRIEMVEARLALTRNEKNQPWTATLADYEGGDPIGWGDTPEDAIADLKAEIEWRNDWNCRPAGSKSQMIE